MQFTDFIVTCCLLAVLAPTGLQHSSPTIPATFPPREPPHPSLPIDQPPVVVHGDRRAPLDAVRMKQQADELAKLAESIPPDVEKTTQGRFPKDLTTRLKRIEKLSKELRREVAE